jgi:hypothetical protein
MRQNTKLGSRVIGMTIGDKVSPHLPRLHLASPSPSCSSVMSNSPPHSPLPIISLDTPPASPTPLEFIECDSPTSPSITSGSPLKRSKGRHIQSQKRLRKTVREGLDPAPHTLVRDSEVDFDVMEPLDLNDPQPRSPSPPRTQLEPSPEDRYYRQYASLVLSDCQPFYQISKTIYVVQGWDRKSGEATVRFTGLMVWFCTDSLELLQSFWFHLQRKRIGNDWAMACFCPSGNPCVHVRFARDYGEEQFPDDETPPHGSICLLSTCITAYPNCPGDADEVILFSRQATDDATFLNHFSIAFGAQTSVKSRAIVSYLGNDTGSGSWACQKDRGGTTICGHITKARHGLQKLVQGDPTARDETANTETPALGESFFTSF